MGAFPPVPAMQEPGVAPGVDQSAAGPPVGADPGMEGDPNAPPIEELGSMAQEDIEALRGFVTGFVRLHPAAEEGAKQVLAGFDQMLRDVVASLVTQPGQGVEPPTLP